MLWRIQRCIERIARAEVSGRIVAGSIVFGSTAMAMQSTS